MQELSGWLASARCTRCARWWTEATHHGVGGHVQDLGLVVRLSYAAERFVQYQTIALSGEMDRQEAERRIFGATHDDIGAALFRFWNLPPDRAGAVAHRHRAAGDDPLTQILRIGDILKSTPQTAADAAS